MRSTLEGKKKSIDMEILGVGPIDERGKIKENGRILFFILLLSSFENVHISLDFSVIKIICVVDMHLMKSTLF